jgi:hypothetical protein
VAILIPFSIGVLLLRLRLDPVAARPSVAIDGWSRRAGCRAANQARC